MKDMVFKIDFDLARQVADQINKENGLYTIDFPEFKKLIGFTGLAERFEHMNVNVNRKFNQFSEDVCPIGMRFKIGKKGSQIYFTFASEKPYKNNLRLKKDEIKNILKNEKNGMNQTEIQKRVGKSYLTREALKSLIEDEIIGKIDSKYILKID